MLKSGVRFRVPVRSLLLLGSLILLPAWARADDFGWSGDSSCSDPAITSDIFTLPQTNASGGLCRAFGNHSNTNFYSLMFSTSYALTDQRDAFVCDPGPFTNCDYRLDGVIVTTPPRTGGTTLTVEFFGTNADHPGIPINRVADPAAPGYFNFYINLNDVDPTTGRQYTGESAPGGWGANNDTITLVANAPEPQTLPLLLLAGVGLVLARARMGRTSGSR